MARGIHKLLVPSLAEMQELETVLRSIMIDTQLPVATGYTLDLTGDPIGEFRVGRADAEYRIAVMFRQILNASGGQPELIIAAVKQFTNSLVVDYSEDTVAGGHVGIVFDGIEVPGIYRLVKSVLMGGVALNLTHHTENAFSFCTDDFTYDAEGRTICVNPSDPNTLGFAELDTISDAGELVELISQ